MIKASELRIGNWIMLLGVDYQHDNKFPDPEGNEPIQVTVDVLKEVERSEADYGPIPITQELLKKCGFRKDEGFDFPDLGMQYILDLPVKGECRNEIFFFFSAPGLKDVSFGEYTVNSAHGSNNIYHLHQLQNLFYCITGQELELHL